MGVAFKTSIPVVLLHLSLGPPIAIKKLAFNYKEASYP